jgi:hypothetical protein
VLDILVDDSAMQPGRLNQFFSYWQEYGDKDKHPEIAKKLRSLEHRYTRRNLASRFQRYVIDVDGMEWNEDLRERYNKPKNRAKTLVDALARRIARYPDKFNQIKHLLSQARYTPALWHFGQQLALNDNERVLLPTLTQLTLETKHQVCLEGYLSAVESSEPERYRSLVRDLLATKNTAWLGATIALRPDYDDKIFVQCLVALEKRWITPSVFEVLRMGKAIESVPPDRTDRLLRQLNDYGSQDALAVLIELLDSSPFDDTSPFTSDFVFGVVSGSLPDDESWDVMRGYHWKNVCAKLIHWDAGKILPLLDTLLVGMRTNYQLSYDFNIAPFADELVQADPAGAWTIVKAHIEETLPKWRRDLLHWLKGGISTFDEKESNGPIVDLPVPEILEWIEKDPEPRAVLIAHATPASLDHDQGGLLTRELLARYGQFDGVQNGISATFHSGGWTGPASSYLKKKREKLRRWLAADFEYEVVQWIEAKIEDLDRSIEREEIDEERSRFE